jgi:glycosyltransferase involved in cell wall biosynthesis
MSQARSEKATLRVVLYTDSPVIGGGENFARDLLASLHPRFEVAVVGNREDIVAHIASRRAGTDTRVLAPVRGRSDLVTLREHARELRELDPDIVHVNQHLWSGQYGVLASKLAGVPPLCVVHGAMLPASSSQRSLTIATARLARHFVGVSHFVSGRIRKELHVDGRRVSTIYNGIPFDEPEPIRRVQTPPGTILGVGRFAREKGFDLLVEAMPHLPGRRLVLVGDGPERSSLENLAASLGIEDRIEFAGWMSEPWASRIRPDLVAVPSRFDAMPLVVLEAMRAGVPVVATRVGGNPELVVDGVTGNLAEPESPVSLAQAMESLLSDPPRREEMARAAKMRLAHRFSDSMMVASYESLYAAISGHPIVRSATSAGPQFAPAPARRNERLLGFVQLLPPETRERIKKTAQVGNRILRTRSLTTNSSAPPGAAASVARLVLQHLGAVHGAVLVLGEPMAGDLIRASSQEITTCDVWDPDPRNLEASLLVDPLEGGSLGTRKYDCEIVVGFEWQGRDGQLVVANLWRALRPGGSLLVAARHGRDGLTEAELRALVATCSPVYRVEAAAVNGDLAEDRAGGTSGELGEWLVAVVERASEETV